MTLLIIDLDFAVGQGDLANVQILPVQPDTVIGLQQFDVQLQLGSKLRLARIDLHVQTIGQRSRQGRVQLADRQRLGTGWMGGLLCHIRSTGSKQKPQQQQHNPAANGDVEFALR